MAKRSYDVLQELNGDSARRVCRKRGGGDRKRSHFLSLRPHTPLSVIEQALHTKNSVWDIFPGRQRNEIPVVAFFFKPNDVLWLDLCNTLNMDHPNVLVVGVTPSIHGVQIYNFPIVVDHSGAICQRMGLRDPLGGGIYPLSAFVIFDRNGGEVARFRIGYDNDVATALNQTVNYIESPYT